MPGPQRCGAPCERLLPQRREGIEVLADGVYLLFQGLQARSDVLALRVQARAQLQHVAAHLGSAGRLLQSERVPWILVISDLWKCLRRLRVTCRC